MATQMSDARRREFLSLGTRTGILSTTRKDGSPHAAPIWFVLDDDPEHADDIVLLTGAETIKGRSLRRDPRAVLTVDEAVPPFSFVTIAGRVTLSDDLEQMLPWSIRIAARYMGEDKAEEFGRRNAVEGELMVRLTPDKIVALDGVAD